jgi:tryptophanyl-tRNA synthetase
LLRQAGSEDQIDDSLLQLGLFAYPVLQAADILLYKYAGAALFRQLEHG